PQATGHRGALMSVTGKTINLALQGGGAHGAFAWGVVDRLLEDERISFDGISATSAGAINATVMTYGLMTGGREGSRDALNKFWRGVSEAAPWGPLQPAFMFFDMMSRLVSPYQFNPLNYNPLRDLLEKSVDFERLRNQNIVK